MIWILIAFGILPALLYLLYIELARTTNACVDASAAAPVKRLDIVIDTVVDTLYDKEQPITEPKIAAAKYASNGEIYIATWLANHNLEFIPQYRFPECADKRALPFDFYIPSMNTCIEYDGRQHYAPVRFFGGDTGFEKRKLHDDIKDRFCERAGIRLIRVPYCYSTREIDSWLSINLL